MKVEQDCLRWLLLHPSLFKRRIDFVGNDWGVGQVWGIRQFVVRRCLQLLLRSSVAGPRLARTPARGHG